MTNIFICNYVGNISQKDLISLGTNDFFTRVNMVNSHFKGLMYHLFKCFCYAIV